ncbi:pseudouridine synthase [Clostridia bacterium]|nr:pseudouridine synthase [Clostridia bacterium]
MSRRAAEVAISAGRVTVNGQVAQLGQKAETGDAITVDGVPLLGVGQFVYVMLNKPRGVVTTMSDERGRKTVAEMVTGAGAARLLPVGRLDMDSEGLLLMTNDNELIHILTHPSNEVEKEYHVWTHGGDLEKLKLDNPSAKISDLSDKLSVVIHEGKKRQVRLMCADAGMKVLRLRRVREGAIVLGDLKVGAWRNLTAKEINYLRPRSVSKTERGEILNV